MRRSLCVLLLALTATALTGCGNKGPLTLPARPAAAPATAPAPAASTASTPTPARP